jgi:D-aminopeptidase
VLNGAGECTGFITAAEWGTLETPVFLTSTLQLGRVYDAACELMLERFPGVAEDFIIPVVGECDDSFLNDARRMQVSRADVAQAWAQADASVGSAAPPAEGAVGSGTGMSCLGFKGGIGTASRVTAAGHTVGVLLMTNFGSLDQLTVAGVPVGRLLAAAGGAPEPQAKPPGSCIGLVVTDAPVDGAACVRLARRVGLGLARAGSVAQHGSGEIFLATSTGVWVRRDDRLFSTPVVSGRGLDPLFSAVVEASEEAVLNSIFACSTVVGRSGNTSLGVPVDTVVELIRRHGRLEDDVWGLIRAPEVMVPRWTTASRCHATLYLPPRSAGTATRASSRRCPIARTT